MRKTKRLLLAIIIISALTGFKLIFHNYFEAVESSKLFIKTIYAEKNLEKAYEDSHQLFKDSVVYKDLYALINKVHKDKIPSEFIILGYGPEPSTKGVSIYISTFDVEPPIYYELVSLKTDNGPYKIGGLWISYEQFDKQPGFEEINEKFE